MGKNKDIKFLNKYVYILENDFEETALELLETQEKLDNANNIIAQQIDHIAMLNKQVLKAKQDSECKDQENSVLKQMYRDDIINGYI